LVPGSLLVQPDTMTVSDIADAQLFNVKEADSGISTADSTCSTDLHPEVITSEDAGSALGTAIVSSCVTTSVTTAENTEQVKVHGLDNNSPRNC